MKDYYTDNGQLMKNVMSRTYRGYTYSIWATYDSTRYTTFKGEKYFGVVLFSLEITDDDDNVIMVEDSYDLNLYNSSYEYTARVQFKRINHNPFNFKYKKITLQENYDRALMLIVEYCLDIITKKADNDANIVSDNAVTRGLPNSLKEIK